MEMLLECYLQRYLTTYPVDSSSTSIFPTTREVTCLLKYHTTGSSVGIGLSTLGPRVLGKAIKITFSMASGPFASNWGDVAVIKLWVLSVCMNSQIVQLA
jgi:hypothetical protein